MLVPPINYPGTRPVSMSFSADGETIAIHSRRHSFDGLLGIIRFEIGLLTWSSPDNSLRAVSVGYKELPLAIAFSLGDQICVINSENIQLLEYSTRKEFINIPAKFKMPTKYISAVFIPGSNNIAANSDDGTIFVFNPRDGNLQFKVEAAEYPDQLALDISTEVSELAVSPDGRLIGVTMGGTVHLLNSKEGNFIGSLQGYGSIVDTISFRQGSSIVASASRDGTIRLWDISTCLETLKIYGNTKFSALAFSPNSALLMAVSNNRRLWLWDVENLRLAAKGNTIPLSDAKCIANWVSTGQHDISSIAFSRDSKHLAWASNDGGVRIWGTSKDNSNFMLGKDEPVSHCVCSLDGSLVISVSYNIIILWDSNSSKPLDRIKLELEVYALALSSDGVLAVSVDDGVSLWTVATEVSISKWKSKKLEECKADYPGRCSTVQTVQPHGIIRALAFSPKGDIIVAGSDDGSLHLWDVKIRKYTQTLYHSTPVIALAFSPDGKILVSGTRRITKKKIFRAIHIRTINEGLWDEKPVHVPIRNDEGLSFWPDGRYVDTGCALFDMKTHRIDDDNYTKRGPEDIIYYRSPRYIMRNGQILLCVNTNFRYLTSVGNMAVLGHRTCSQLTFVRFKLV